MPKGQQPVTDSDRLQIMELYVEGYSMANVRKVMNLQYSQETIKKTLITNGIEIRQKGSTVRKILPMKGRFANLK